MNLNQATLPAADINDSVRFYTQMGFTQIVDAPHYARFECPTGEATFSLHKVDYVTPDTDVVIYFECNDLDSKVASLKDAGFIFASCPEERRWLWREASLIDPSGSWSHREDNPGIKHPVSFLYMENILGPLADAFVA